MDSTVAPPDGFVVDALPQGFVVDQGDPRLAMQDDLARAADRATAAKRNPAKDPEVLALQTKLYKMPAFGPADAPAPPDGFVVDGASPVKQSADLYGQARDMLTAGPKQLNDLLTGENALPVLLGKFAGYVSRKAELTNAMRAPDEDGVSPIEREIQRRKNAGEPTDFRSVEAWMDQTIEKKLFPAKPAPVDPLEYGKQVVQGVIDHPLDAAKGFVSYAVTHPEVLAAGPIGGLLLMAGESTMEQKVDTGKVDASKLLVDTGLNAVPILAIHAAVRAGNLRAAKTTGAEPTAKAEEQMLEAINAKAKEGISEGQEPQAAATAALDDVLAVMKIAPEERAAIVKGAEDAISEGPKPEGDRQEHQGTGVDRTEAVPGNRDSVAGGGQRSKQERATGSVTTEYIIDNPLGGDGLMNVRVIERKDGSVTAFDNEGNPIDITVAIKKRGLTPEQAIAEAMGDHGPNEQPDPSKVRPVNAQEPAQGEPGPVAPRKSTEQRYGEFIGDYVKREVQESRGHEILDDMEEAGISPSSVGEKFWSDTYYKLPAQVQQRFAKLLERQGGPEPSKAREWLDLPESAADLEGTERGFVALMKEANDRVAGGTETAARAPEPAKLGGPKELPSQTNARVMHERSQAVGRPPTFEESERLRLAQAGKADPKLLAMLALPGIGAAAGYWLGGNTGERVRDALIGGGIGAASLLLGKVRGAALRVVDAISDKRYNPVDLFREHAQDIALGRLSGYQFAEGLKALVKDPKRREAMTFALESGDRAGLSPVESEALGQYEKWMRSVRDGAVKSGVDMGRVLDNYATHAYLRGMNTKEGLVDNLLNIMKEQGGTGGMSPKSRWAKQRVIPSYQEAMARGLIPVTTDIAEIARMYTDSVTRTVANKHFLDALAKSKTPAGEPLLARGADLEKEIKRRQSEALGRDPEMGPSEKLDADIAAIKAPSDYVFVNHPQLRDFKVHRDMAAPLRALMDATDPLAIEKALHGVAVAAKSVIFSGSLFHAKSLVDAAMGTGLGAFKRGALKEIRDPNNALVKEAVASGLNIIDRPMEAEIAPMRNALRMIEEKTPFPVSTSVKAMRTLQDKMNHFLWGVVHPTLKYNVWKSIYERALTDPTIANRLGRKLGMAPNWDGMGRGDIARMATSYTNDVFGGINWFEIANSVNSHYLRDLALGFASPRGRRLMQIIMLAPDWTVATARSMYKAFPGMSEPQVAALHRQYLLRQSIIYLTAYNAINQALSGHHIWENKDPTMIDAGDGRRIQMAKHTMEPIHWLTQPGQQLWNKLGYPIKEPILQAFGKDWISLKGGDVGGPPMGNRLTHALKSTLPIPTTTAADKGIVPAVTGFLGVPMYGRTEQQAIDDAIERALNLRAKRLDSDDPAEQAKANKKSQSDTAASAKARVTRQYQKQRDEQRQREAR